MHLRRVNSWQLTLSTAALLSLAGQFPAMAAHKPHHHSTRHVVTEEQTEADPQAQESQQPSAPEQSADETRKPAAQPGISLFNIFWNVIEIAVLVVLLGAVPMSAMVLFCAMIWHSQKAMNGGKKPSIG